MKNFPMLDDPMHCVHAVDIDPDEEQAARMYMKMLASAGWRERLAVEIKLAFKDNAFSWTRFLDRHDVYFADSESDARAYAEAPLGLKGRRGWRSAGISSILATGEYDGFQGND